MFRVRAAIIGLVLATMSIMALPATASPNLAKLYRMFQVEDVGSEYVVAVDTSLSMKTIYPQVVTALQAFMATTMEPRDRLTIISFDNQPKLVYTGPARGRRRIEGALPGQPSPQGQKTDMGAAVDTIIERLRRSKEDLQVVVFLTDGAEDPPPESRFARDNERSWRELAGRAAAARRGRTIKVHGIGLNANTDVARLKQVFPEASPLTVSPGGLSVYFSQLKERIKRDRLRLKVRRELSRGSVRVEAVGGDDWGEVWAGRDVARRFVISSHYRRLPVRIRVRGVAPPQLTVPGRGGSALTVRILGPKGSFNLPPGGRHVVAMQAKVSGQRSGRLKVGRTRQQWRRVLTLRLDGQLEPSGALSELGLSPAARVVGARQTVSAYRMVGTPLYLAVAVAGLALAGLAGLARLIVWPAGLLAYRRVVAPPLFGRLAFSGSPEGRPLPPPVSLAGLGRRAVMGTEGAIGLEGELVRPRHAELYGRWGDDGPAVWLRKLEGDVSVASSVVTGGRRVTDEVRLERGCVIELGDYTIQWV